MPNIHKAIKELHQTRTLQKLYAHIAEIVRFPEEKRVPPGLDIEFITDPTASVQRNRVSVWFDPDSSKNPARSKDCLVFQGHQDVEDTGYFASKPKIDVYKPGDWEAIVSELWEGVKADEAKMRDKARI